MRYNNSFILAISLSIIIGALFAILIDNSKINQKPLEQNNLKKKNKIQKINNIINKINNKNTKNNKTNTNNKTTTNNINNKINDDIYKNSNHSNKNHSNIINILNEDDDEIRQPIPIAISIDDKYTFPALVFITSLMENIGKKTKYEIYIMIADGYSENNKNKFKKLIKKYGNEKLKITFLDMKDKYVPITSHSYISKATYYRVYLPYLLPEVEKLIYLDVDIINLHDLSEFYNMKLEKDIYLYAMVDNSDHRKELLEFGVKSDKYINGGTLLMDLKNIREKGFDEKLKKFMEIYGKNLTHHDQTAMNAVYYKNMGILPFKYVIFNFKTFEDLVKFNDKQEEPYRRSMDELKEAYNNPFLVHFAGCEKPWQRKKLTFREYWWYYAKKSDFYNEILKFYKFSESEINWLIRKINKK